MFFHLVENYAINNDKREIKCGGWWQLAVAVAADSQVSRIVSLHTEITQSKMKMNANLEWAERAMDLATIHQIREEEKEADNEIAQLKIHS